MKKRKPWTTLSGGPGKMDGRVVREVGLAIEDASLLASVRRSDGACLALKASLRERGAIAIPCSAGLRVDRRDEILLPRRPGQTTEFAWAKHLKVAAVGDGGLRLSDGDAIVVKKPKRVRYG